MGPFAIPFWTRAIRYSTSDSDYTPGGSIEVVGFNLTLLTLNNDYESPLDSISNGNIDDDVITIVKYCSLCVG